MDLVIKAEPRDLGTKAVQIRKQGFIPASVYGHDFDSTPIQVPYHVFHKALKHGALKVEIKWSSHTQLVAIEEIQKNPRDNKVVHISFHALKQNEKTHMHVPLHFEGEAKGKKEGGVVMQQINELNVFGYPKDIPDEIVIDVTELKMDESIHVSDLVGKYKFEFAEEDLEKTVAVCHYPKIQEVSEPEAVEAAEADATPEGEAAPQESEAPAEAPVEEKKAA